MKYLSGVFWISLWTSGILFEWGCCASWKIQHFSTQILEEPHSRPVSERRGEPNYAKFYGVVDAPTFCVTCHLIALFRSGAPQSKRLCQISKYLTHVKVRGGEGVSKSQWSSMISFKVQVLDFRCVALFSGDNASKATGVQIEAKFCPFWPPPL